MSSSSVYKGMSDYQETVRKLSASIGAASVDWQDEVFSGLQTLVASVADASRQVIEAGSRAGEDLARFERIMSER